MKNRTSDAQRSAPPAAALYVGPMNCEAVVGLPWRRVRDHARELGVPVVHFGKALLVPVDLLVEALRSLSASPTSSTEQQPAANATDPAASIRERLGVRRVG